MPIASQPADALSIRHESRFSRLLANVRLLSLELSGWKTGATPIGRNKGEAGDCPTKPEYQ
jgi:hypothetical protein